MAFASIKRLPSSRTARRLSTIAAAFLVCCVFIGSCTFELRQLRCLQPATGEVLPWNFLVVGRTEDGEFHLCNLFRQSRALQQYMETYHSRSEVAANAQSEKTGIHIVYPEDEISTVPFLQVSNSDKIKAYINRQLPENGRQLGNIDIRPVAKDREQVTLKIWNDDYTETYVYQVGKAGIYSVAYLEWGPYMGAVAMRKAFRITLYFLAAALPLFFALSLFSRRRRGTKGAETETHENPDE